MSDQVLASSSSPGTALPSTSRRTGPSPDSQIWEQLRQASKKASADSRPRPGCGSWLCQVLLCLTPDPVEQLGVFAGKEMLKATVDTLSLLQTVALLDPSDIALSLKKVFGVDQPDWDACQFDRTKTGKPGFLTSSEMIYACRLSLIAYLTHMGYDDFMPLHRETELLNKVFSLDGSNEVHQVFLVNYVSSLFDQTRLADSGLPSTTFGQSKPLQTNLEPMNLVLVKEFNVRFNQGFVARSRNLLEQGGDIVIAFQGTVDREDAFTSAQGSSTPFEPLFDGPNAGQYACWQGRGLGSCCGAVSQEQLALRNKADFGRVHVGFYNAFLCVKPVIQAELEALLQNGQLNDKVVRIVVTGHSLGGALACLCTAWLMQWFGFVYPGGLPSQFRLLSVTFGQPKVGNAEFCRAVQQHEWTNRNKETGQEAKFKTYRVFSPLDPVITTPPAAMGFSHCYSMCALKGGSLYFLPPGFAKLSDRTNVGIKNAIDHGMSILQFHDLFCYLSNVMHFADLTRVLEDQGDLDDVFGVVDYQAQVTQPGFLERF